MIKGRTTNEGRICPETMTDVENREDELLIDRVTRKVGSHLEVDLKSGQLSHASSEKGNDALQQSQG